MKENINDIMSKILDVRYSDIEEEKRLCLMLLEMPEAKNDIYVKTYAQTYLGDYYIAKNNYSKAFPYLKEARAAILAGDEWDKLSVRIYSLSGLCYEVQTDSRNAMECWMEALAVSRRQKDIFSECVVLNNLALGFQRHQSYEIAAFYLKEACDLQRSQEEFPIRTQLLSNLGDLMLQAGRLNEAKAAYIECETNEKDEVERELYRSRNWCCYYAEAGDRKETIKWAKRAGEAMLQQGDELFGAFENYDMLCESMLKIKNASYAKEFLIRMKETCAGVLEAFQSLEEKELRYSITFEGEREQAEAYKRFYVKNEEFKGKVNKAIVMSMKEKIYLEEVMQQKNTLLREQKNLQEEANKDELTGLYNRRYMEQLVKKYEENPNIGYGVLMIDVDYFKEYNDYYSHLEGDKVLQTVGQCLQNNCIKGIKACRFGGDEFSCLCENVKEEDMRNYIEGIRTELYNKNIIHEKSLCSDRITLSIGYVYKNAKDQIQIQKLLQIADEALYDSKLSGRNTYKKKSVM